MTTTDGADLDRALHEALRAHGESVDVDRPEFDRVLRARQRVLRRRAAVAGVATLALGVGGLMLAATRADQPGETATGAVSLEMPSTTDGKDWSCTGPLGVDDIGRELFAECVPIVEEGFTDWACSGRLGIDDVGRVRFDECEPVGQLGPPADRSGPLTHSDLPPDP